MSTEPQDRLPLTGISSMATRSLLSALTAQYERETQTRVVIESVGGVDAARRVQDGEAVDIVMLASDAIARLAAAHKVHSDSVVAVVCSSIALAVKADAGVPCITTQAHVRAAVMRARTVGYSTGPSGVHVRQFLQRWGVSLDGLEQPAAQRSDARSDRPRAIQARPGVSVGSLIASGEVDLGFQQLSELRDIEGITVVGVLPPPLQSVTTFSAAMSVSTRNPAATNAFLAFLASPAVAQLKIAHGMVAA